MKVFFCKVHFKVLLSQPTAVELSRFVEASSACIAQQFLTPDGQWGLMEPKRWGDFVDFLCTSGIVRGRAGEAIPREAIEVESLFTNRLLP